MSHPANDAAFFDMVHALLDEQMAGSEPERRGSARHPYNCIQLLAPFDGKRLPAQADFRKVHCQDISATGLSFCSPRKPETQYVVIALGAVPFSFYVAEVMHAQPVNNDGVVEYLVGCRLMRRITRAGDAGGPQSGHGRG